jgi:hypothetical protein
MNKRLTGYLIKKFDLKKRGYRVGNSKRQESNWQLCKDIDGAKLSVWLRDIDYALWEFKRLPSITIFIDFDDEFNTYSKKLLGDERGSYSKELSFKFKIPLERRLDVLDPRLVVTEEDYVDYVKKWEEITEFYLLPTIESLSSVEKILQRLVNTNCLFVPPKGLLGDFWCYPAEKMALMVSAMSNSQLYPVLRAYYLYVTGDEFSARKNKIQRGISAKYHHIDKLSTKQLFTRNTFIDYTDSRYKKNIKEIESEGIDILENWIAKPEDVFKFEIQFLQHTLKSKKALVTERMTLYEMSFEEANKRSRGFKPFINHQTILTFLLEVCSIELQIEETEKAYELFKTNPQISEREIFENSFYTSLKRDFLKNHDASLWHRFSEEQHNFSYDYFLEIAKRKYSEEFNRYNLKELIQSAEYQEKYHPRSYNTDLADLLTRLYLVRSHREVCHQLKSSIN